MFGGLDHLTEDELNSIVKVLGYRPSLRECGYERQRNTPTPGVYDEVNSDVENDSDSEYEEEGDEDDEELQRIIEDAVGDDDINIPVQGATDELKTVLNEYYEWTKTQGWDEIVASSVAWIVLCEVSGCYFPVERCSIIKGVNSALRGLCSGATDSVHLSVSWVWWFLCFMAIVRDGVLIRAIVQDFLCQVNEATKKKEVWPFSDTHGASLKFLTAVDAALTAATSLESRPDVSQRCHTQIVDTDGRGVAIVRDLGVTGGTRSKAGLTKAKNIVETCRSYIKKHSGDGIDGLSFLASKCRTILAFGDLSKVADELRLIFKTDQCSSSHCARTVWIAVLLASHDKNLPTWAHSLLGISHNQLGVGENSFFPMSDTQNSEGKQLGVKDAAAPNSAAEVIAKLDAAIERLIPRAVRKDFLRENQKRTPETLEFLVSMCLRGPKPNRHRVTELLVKMHQRQFETSHKWRYSNMHTVCHGDSGGLLESKARKRPNQKFDLMSRESQKFGGIVGVDLSFGAYKTLPSLPMIHNFDAALREAQVRLDLEPEEHYLEKPMNFHHFDYQTRIGKAVVRKMGKLKKPITISDVLSCSNYIDPTPGKKYIYFLHVRTIAEHKLAEDAVDVSQHHKNNVQAIADTRKVGSMLSPIGTIKIYDSIQLQEAANDRNVLVLAAARFEKESKRQKFHARENEKIKRAKLIESCGSIIKL